MYIHFIRDISLPIKKEIETGVLIQLKIKVTPARIENEVNLDAPLTSELSR